MVLLVGVVLMPLMAWAKLWARQVSVELAMFLTKSLVGGKRVSRAVQAVCGNDEECEVHPRWPPLR